MALVAAIVVVAAVSVVVAVRRHGHTQLEVCADVGLEGPTAATPDAALAAYVESQGGSSADWKRTDDLAGDRESYIYEPVNPGARPHLKSISVGRAGTTWHADGACV